jgi:hypothetical protein
MRGLKLVRYGDDIVVCCHTQAEAEATLKRVTRLLANLDLSVNPDDLIRELVQRGHGRIVAHVSTTFFLVEEMDGRIGLRRIAELPGSPGVVCPSAQTCRSRQYGLGAGNMGSRSTTS